MVQEKIYNGKPIIYDKGIEARVASEINLLFAEKRELQGNRGLFSVPNVNKYDADNLIYVHDFLESKDLYLLKRIEIQETKIWKKENYPYFNFSILKRKLIEDGEKKVLDSDIYLEVGNMDNNPKIGRCLWITISVVRKLINDGILGEELVNDPKSSEYGKEIAYRCLMEDAVDFEEGVCFGGESLVEYIIGLKEQK